MDPHSAYNFRYVIAQCSMINALLRAPGLEKKRVELGLPEKMTDGELRQLNAIFNKYVEEDPMNLLAFMQNVAVIATEYSRPEYKGSFTGRLEQSLKCSLCVSEASGGELLLVPVVAGLAEEATEPVCKDDPLDCLRYLHRLDDSVRGEVMSRCGENILGLAKFIRMAEVELRKKKPETG